MNNQNVPIWTPIRVAEYKTGTDRVLSMLIVVCPYLFRDGI